MVIGAAIVLLVASFLPFFSVDGRCADGVSCTWNAWAPATFPTLPTVHLAAVIVAVLFAAARTLPADRRIFGLGLSQWGTALAVFVGWAALWSAFADLLPELPGTSNPNKDIQLGVGAWLTIVFGVGIAVAAVLASRTPTLQAPLLPSRPAPSPYGAGPTPGYGYPSGGQQPQPGQGYGYPGGPQGPAATGPEFAPFWFAVPVTRPLYGEDGAPTPIAELAPGTWYLAVDQRGQALIAQTQDGRRGVLQDTTGIQRG